MRLNGIKSNQHKKVSKCIDKCVYDVINEKRLLYTLELMRSVEHITFTTHHWIHFLRRFEIQKGKKSNIAKKNSITK